MDIKASDSKIVLYTDKNGNVELRADVEKDTLWATQEQIARLFETERSVVTKHINNIFKDSEVEQKSNVQKMHIANADRPVAFYSLDIVLAVGYRTNSKKAITFRKWATMILHDYLVRGYNLNQRRLVDFPEAIEGLDEALAVMSSKKYQGKLKGKMTLKLTRHMLPKD